MLPRLQQTASLCSKVYPCYRLRSYCVNSASIISPGSLSFPQGKQSPKLDWLIKPIEQARKLPDTKIATVPASLVLHVARLSVAFGSEPATFLALILLALICDIVLKDVTSYLILRSNLPSAASVQVAEPSRRLLHFDVFGCGLWFLGLLDL